MKADTPYIAVWIVLAIAATVALWVYVPIPFVADLAIALNASTFVLYGLDKFQAVNRGWRVPERTLYLATFFGGSIGALVGMHVFRHKTRKVSFQLVLAVLILVQVLIFYAFWKL